MTSPPYRYDCWNCKHQNWLMPHPKLFTCEKCGKKNKVKTFLNRWWCTKADEGETKWLN